MLSRRQFLQVTALGTSVSGLSFSHLQHAQAAKPVFSDMEFGLVTYLWGRDWDLQTLIKNCETAKVLGVELEFPKKS